MGDAPRSPRLSERGGGNVAAIMPKISAAVAERSSKSTTNIDLSTSENWLIRDELVEICKSAVNENLTAQHFSYPRGFAGDPDLLESLASFFNEYFKPCVPVLPSHLATAPGSSSCLDALLYNICNPNDGVLVPGPYWNGFDFQFRARSSVQPVVVNVPGFDETFGMGLVSSLQEAYDTASCPIRALILTNPHNPFGQCYPKAVVEACMRFCEEKDIFYVSDEVYAMTSFTAADLPNPASFVSALSIDAESIGCTLARVHTIWSISKDFGSSGLRMGCSVTQDNKELSVGLALAANTQTSSLAAIYTTQLLSSPRLGSLIELNSHRLEQAYEFVSAFFLRHSIRYIPVNAGLYVFAKLSPRATTWDDEAEMVAKLKQAGVLVSAGRAYHGVEKEKGWARLTFSLDQNQLEEALRRIEIALDLKH